MDGRDRFGKSLGRDCIKLIQRKLAGVISKEEFYSELINLHKKYPMSGYEPPLAKTRMDNYQERNVIENYENVHYWDKTYPKNFWESAQMYSVNIKKEDDEF